MDNPDIPRTPAAGRQRLHPLVASAAIAVIALSAVGITVLVMNRSNATPSPYDAAPIAAADVPSTTSTATQAPTSRGAAPSTPVYETRPAAPPPPRRADEPPLRVASAATCHDCGTIEAINDIKVQGQGTGVGAVGGAVVGGLLGNLVGAGRGKALATVAGAVGGGFGGNAIEKRVRADTEYQLVIRLDDGGTRTFTQAEPPSYAVGERIRIVDGRIERA